jgi:hypothetical protein
LWREPALFSKGLQLDQFILVFLLESVHCCRKGKVVTLFDGKVSLLAPFQSQRREKAFPEAQASATERRDPARFLEGAETQPGSDRCANERPKKRRKWDAAAPSEGRQTANLANPDRVQGIHTAGTEPGHEASTRPKKRSQKPLAAAVAANTADTEPGSKRPKKRRLDPSAAPAPAKAAGTEPGHAAGTRPKQRRKKPSAPAAPVNGDGPGGDTAAGKLPAIPTPTVGAEGQVGWLCFMGISLNAIMGIPSDAVRLFLDSGL